MASRRQRQVAELLHQEISQLIQYRTQDPRLGFVTVTGVEVSPDLSYAKVYVTVLGDEADVQSTLAGLESASGYFRRELGQVLTLRYVPKLVFKLDTSLEQGMQIDNLLDRLKEEQSSIEDDENSTGIETDD
ncbi:MAG: 30S ribosome-binding factor RbfA [Chloroflexota bacterium]